ncbi:scavenger receptor cysteine-rich type 1 protein M130-like isoform 2-T2 [Spinachia spinachia]
MDHLLMLLLLLLWSSDSIRLVDGSSHCSGRLEVRSHQSNQWSSVCEEDFDQQGAEVVCRELGCGAPSVLQGALYGEVEAPMWTKGFQCGGHESALLDCRSSGSERNTCSPAKAVGLTCSEPLRLVGGASRCEGTLEVKHQGEWRPLAYNDITLKSAVGFCRDLLCQYAVSSEPRVESSARPTWRLKLECVDSGSSVRECLTSFYSSSILDLVCSEPAHQGSYSCVYHVSMHHFTSESRLLSVSVEDPTPLIIKAVLLPLMLLWVNVALYFYCKTTRGRKLGRREDFELHHHHLGVEEAEEEGAQGAE